MQPMTVSPRQWQKWLCCMFLGVAVMLVFWPALRCGFVYFDDPEYVLKNHNIQHGLNWETLKWAFTSSRAANWHPVTWLSHAVDCQLYGLNPVGHHLTNVLLHLANSLLLFLLLERLTGDLGPSFFVAAIFALHPLRTESVVWISERKDVLSGFFWVLTVWAYALYAQESKSKSERLNRRLFYAASVVFFALGLMAKPMLVTVPFVLLLLDFWPLRRLEIFSWKIVWEKIPFLALAAGESVVTFMVQQSSGAMGTFTSYPLNERLANIPVAYVRYIARNFWPSGLAVHYPLRTPGLLAACGATCVVVAITILAVRRWRTQPYFAVGWFWFLGMLVPTIGFVQVGTQSMADRYSYLPCIGLWIVVAWWIAGKIPPIPRTIAAAGGALAIIACIVLTPIQEQYWRDTRTLFMRDVAVTGEHYLAYYNIGCSLMDEGEYSEAVTSFKEGLKYGPNDSKWLDHSQGYNDLGYSYLQIGQMSNAVASFDKAVRIQPHYPEAYYNLGRAFLENGQPDVAVECFRTALAQDSTVADIHYKYANALEQLGRHAEAIAEYSTALRLRPNMDEAANNLAWLLATCSDRSLRNTAMAITLAHEASEHSHDRNPLILGTLAEAYGQAGRLPEAIATAQQARELALAQNNKKLAATLENQLR
ncbi:MAG TPA: tetratricopeptide repeat protein, partial [Verrucomicrobiae bacterium]|nr:tetratricopeptide repeat protein [Verrucomicrobiae bacterium]